MNTLRVARILDKGTAWSKEKDVRLIVNVPIVHLEDAYRLQDKKILEDFRIPRKQTELPTVLFVPLSN